MKRLLSVFILSCLLIQHATPEPWGGTTITVTSGTAIRLATTRTMVSSFVVQMLPGGTGLGYLLYAPPSFTCHKGSAGTITIAELQPATSTAPGGNVTVPSNPDPIGGIDLAGYCVDGSNSTDTILVSWNIRN